MLWSSCPQQSSGPQSIKCFFFPVSSSFSSPLILSYTQFHLERKNKAPSFILCLPQATPILFSAKLIFWKNKCALLFAVLHTSFTFQTTAINPSRPWRLLSLKSPVTSFSQPKGQISFLTQLTLVQHLLWMSIEFYLEMLLFLRFHRRTAFLFLFSSLNAHFSLSQFHQRFKAFFNFLNIKY